MKQTNMNGRKINNTSLSTPKSSLLPIITKGTPLSSFQKTRQLEKRKLFNDEQINQPQLMVLLLEK